MAIEAGLRDLRDPLRDLVGRKLPTTCKQLSDPQTDGVEEQIRPRWFSRFHARTAPMA